MVGLQFTLHCSLLLYVAHGFAIPSYHTASRASDLVVCSANRKSVVEPSTSTRRCFNENLTTGLLFSSASLVAPTQAWASGGATAGGAYLLSVS